MDEKEVLKERFKSAVSSAIKVISENFDVEISFGNSANTKKNSLSLPELASLKNLQDFTNLRAFADSEALKMKYTNEKIYIKKKNNLPLSLNFTTDFSIPTIKLVGFESSTNSYSQDHTSYIPMKKFT